VREAGRRHGVAETSIHRWRAKYGEMQVGDARRLKALENENRRPKRLVAEQALDIVMLKDVGGAKMVTTTQRRQVVTHLLAAYPVSARHACGLVALSRSRWHHRPPRSRHPELRERLKAIAGERPRWGLPAPARAAAP
jgi:putative transposase